ncbi:aromatic ring-hydroxylating oxygenase subunit alpha [Singulisphaera sp. PoT]|uniref:aromatic ring-hydroxylating oxygenase subunit alpha n=1 Tax=Singulisphaera sp. PoT TaxID=3411797 RepID=UPI003BF4F0CA
MKASSIAELVARRIPEHSLEREFYSAEGVYEADLEAIWRKDWLFAGHTCQIPRPGDYFLFEMDTESLVILRDDEGRVRAFHNLCRHRGSLLCDRAAGRAKQLVCPYHQWVYAKDGSLIASRGMPDDFDRASHGLIPAAVRDVAGLIYVSLNPEPTSFDGAFEVLGHAARPQGLERAKVAERVDYEVPGNWKLVWENNRECYHCNVNHPQYIKANFDHYNSDDTTPAIRRELDASVERAERAWRDAGLSPTHRSQGMTSFPDGDVWYSANRTVLVDGYVSETMDGRQVAPLMGDYRSSDVGTLRMRSLPNFWNHSSCDHAVSTRLLPAGPQKTLVTVYWLVHEDAEEGRDYRLDTLLPFWRLTSEQDWEIVKNAQRGVNSRVYRPGPYSPAKEYNVEAFMRWYLRRLTAAGLAEDAR